MKLTKTLLISAIMCGSVVPASFACESIFEHKSDMKDGRVQTVLLDDADIDGHENCMNTFAEKASLTPIKGKGLKVNIKTRNFTKKGKAKIAQAVKVMKSVINSKQFRSKVYAHEYAGKKSYANNRGLSNTGVYNKIMTGAETIQNKKDKEMDLDVTLYYEDSTVIGYTYPNTTRIWVNSKYFNKFGPHSIAGNLTHEWLHKVGFGHDYEATKRRPYSVPYGVGRIMSGLAR